MELFKVYPLMDIEPVSADGCWITNKDGEKFLDLYGGHAVISIGHSHPRYIENMESQLRKISFYSNSVQNPLQSDLAKKIGSISGLGSYTLFLCNSGTEANEAALRLAQLHTGKRGVIALVDGFHGRTAGSSAVTSNAAIKPQNNMREYVHFVKVNDFQGLADAFLKSDVGAVIIECIQGIGGVNMLSEEFYSAASKLCKEHKAVLIADEVQSGFGRTGKFFSFQHLDGDHLPDLVTMAKGMGNGYPVGGVLIQPEIKAEFGLLGSTFGGNYLACTAAMSVLDVIQSEGLMQKAQDLGKYLLDCITAGNQIVGLREFRGKGLMIGLVFDFPVKELRNELLTEHNILTGSSSNPYVLRILPPLNVSKEEIDLFITALKKVLKRLESKTVHEKVYISK